MLAFDGRLQPAINILGDNAQRRIISADLQGLLDILNRSPSQDLLTRDLRFWHERFSLEFRRHPDGERVKNQFMNLLQEILVDPVSHTPLDEEAVLGSDGITYGSFSLALYLDSAPAAYKQRSPMHPDDPTPFIIQPHPVAKELIQWLKRNENLLLAKEQQENDNQAAAAHMPGEQNEHIRRIREREAASEGLKTRYRAFSNQPAVAHLPNERNERIRLIRERQAERAAQAQAGAQAFAHEVQQLRNVIGQDVRQAFAPVHQRAGEVAAQQFRRLDNLEADDRAQFEMLLRAAAHLREEIAQLQQENEALQARIDRVGVDVAEVEREDARLQVSINEVRQSLKERKSGWLNALFSGIAVLEPVPSRLGLFKEDLPPQEALSKELSILLIKG